MIRHYQAVFVAAIVGVLGVGTLAGAAEPPADGDDSLGMKGLSNEVATARLALYLSGHGIQAENKDNKIIQVRYEGGTFLMKPSLSEHGIDRIIVYKQYRVRDERRGSARLPELVAIVNGALNVGTFSLTGENRSLVLQGQVTFIDTLPEQELREYLRWFNRAMISALRVMPELKDYLS